MYKILKIGSFVDIQIINDVDEIACDVWLVGARIHLGVSYWKHGD